ncbi:unknown [Plasmavirus L2]|uniref:Uncharacterized 18.2 kDa protein n=1 Tax=Acholeplasma phage L2 TaxID=46014 RepID=YO04_BPL2|nr:hypothetical protein L2_05 [Plasmavirus L2]P42539.1 RecName: Full=Uncharacterized 18.2 kDa protein; AltName: Full=ORF4 [Plasmavirus L2]AAA87960.1 unknown [Plasmavirus L2]
MQENAMEAANWALTIFFYGLSWFIAVGSIMILWPVWEYLKKKAHEQKLKGEEIIVAQAMTEQKLTIDFLREEAAVKELERLKAESLEIKERNAVEIDGIDYQGLTTIELKAKAKELGITGISRRSKNQLIEDIKQALIEQAVETENVVLNDDAHAHAVASV